MRKIVCIVLALLLALIAFPSISLKASEAEPEAEYKAVISDEDGYLQPFEEAGLLEQMSSLSEKTNIGILIIFSGTYTKESQMIEAFKNENFGEDADCTIIFVNRSLKEHICYIKNYGRNAELINSNDCTLIEESVYEEFSRNELYAMLSKMLPQIEKDLEGKKASKPIQIISAMFVALIISVLINYLVMLATSNYSKKKSKTLMKNASRDRIDIYNEEALYLETTKRYNPRSK